MYVNDNIVTYFDSFRVEHIPKEIKKFIGNKNIITNIYRTQAFDSIMCGYFCIGFIDIMLKGKSLLDCTSLFSLHDYEKNDEIMLKYFQWLKRWKKKYIALFVISIEKTLVLSITCSKCKNEVEKLYKEKESIEVVKILGLIENI